LGGRKSYPSKNLIGKSEGAKKSFKDLKGYLDSGNIEKISASAFKTFSESKTSIDYSAFSNKLSPFIINNFSRLKAEKDDKSLRLELSKAWSEVKSKNDIKVPKEVDRIVVDSAFKSLRGDSDE